MSAWRGELLLYGRHQLRTQQGCNFFFSFFWEGASKAALGIHLTAEVEVAVAVEESGGEWRGIGSGLESETWEVF